MSRCFAQPVLTSRQKTADARHRTSLMGQAGHVRKRIGGDPFTRLELAAEEFSAPLNPDRSVLFVDRAGAAVPAEAQFRAHRRVRTAIGEDVRPTIRPER